MSSSQTDLANYLKSVAGLIITYSLWLILPTCIIGNLISLYIYSRPSLNKKTNVGFLYRWLCFINLVTILYYCFVTHSSKFLNNIGYTVSLPCGVGNYFSRSLFTSISWMQAIIAVDRLVCVVFPLKKAFMDKRIFLYGIMVSLLVLILISQIPTLLTYPVTSAKNITSCFISTQAKTASTLCLNLMRIFIPFGIMLTLNLIVIWHLKQSKRRVNATNVIQTGSSQQTNGVLGKKELRFAVSTLLIDFVFLVFYLPMGADYIIQIYKLYNNSLTSDPVIGASYQIYTNTCLMLSLAHTSALFFVFVIFNRYYRVELFALFRLNRFFSNQQITSTGNSKLTMDNSTKNKMISRVNGTAPQIKYD